MEFRCALFGPARIRTAHSHPRLHGTWLAFRHSMIGKSLCDARNAEAVNSHAEMGDSGLGVCAALGQADVLGPGPDSETCGYALAMLNGQPEEALVIFHRPLPVGNRERHVIECAYTDWRLARLPQYLRSRGQRRQR